MGLFTTYLGYKYGKRRAEKAADLEAEMRAEVCSDCGFPRFMHDDNTNEDCPIQ